MLKLFRRQPLPAKIKHAKYLCNVRRPIDLPILVAKVWRRNLDYTKNLQVKYFTGENILIYGRWGMYHNNSFVLMQTPLSELDPETQFTFEWKRAAAMPFNVTEYSQAVVIDGKVYIGGRLVSSQSTYDTMQTVLVYDSCLNEWSTLPPYECVYFAMAAVNNQLVLIGGCDVHERDLAAHLSVWDGKWEKKICSDANSTLFSISYYLYQVAGGNRRAAARY